MIRRLLNGTHTTSSPDICFFVSPTSLTNTRERSLTSNDLLSYLNSKNLNPDRQILVYVGQMGFFKKLKLYFLWVSATLLYSLSHLTLKSKMRTHFWPQHTFQQPRKKRQPIISYSDYLIRVSKYYNRYQVSYTVYSKEGYTIGVCYHLIGEVYWIRRYTGVYKPLCMRSFPDLSLPGESAQPKRQSKGSEQWVLLVGSNWDTARRKDVTVYIL